MCKIEQNIVKNAVTQVTGLTGYCWQTYLRWFYRCQCIWKHIITLGGHGCMHCCIYLSKLLSLSYVFILIKKVKGHILFKNTQFNLSCWMKWLFGKYSVLLNTFELLTLVIFQSWTLPFCDQIKEEFKRSNSIFELLNFRPIWIYNFWTLELFLYLNI